MKHYFSRPIYSLIIILTLASSFQPPQALAKSRLTPEEVKKILRETGDHLTNMQEPSGRYHYEYHPFTGEYTNEDGIVRQVAAVYSMSLLYDVFRDSAYLERMKKTAEYWLQHSAAMERDGKILRSFPDDGTGKLGSNALFIIGTRILKKEDPAWWKKHASQIQEVANTILWLQQSSGGFGQSINETLPSDYFDGEAMLALLTIYEDEARPEIKAAIYAALAYFEKTYTASYAKGLYLWAMTAMRLGHRLFHDERFVKFADRHEALKREILPLAKPKFTNNICTSFEGLSQWLLMHRAMGEKYKKEEEYLEAALIRTAKLQVKKGTIINSSLLRAHDASAKRVKNLASPVLSEALLTIKTRALAPGYGGFLTSLKKPVQRIDFQQHCIHAYAGYLQLMETPP